jgi:hypothetical protein
MRDTPPLTCFSGFRPLILAFVVFFVAFTAVFFFFAMTVSSGLGPLKSLKVFGRFRRVASGLRPERVVRGAISAQRLLSTQTAGSS